MNTLLSSMKIHSFLKHRSSSFVLLEKVPHLSVKNISNSSAWLAKSEKENEGFMSRMKKIFGKASERSFGRMILIRSKSDTVDKNISAFLYHCENVPLVRYSGHQRLVNFCPKYETGSYRQMSLLSSLRSAFGLNPRNSKPAPIREPNIPQKPVRDDKKDKKHKKPVLQTEENSEEEVTHVRSAMMDEHGNLVTEENFVRTEWGVRIKDQARKVDPQTDAVETIEKPFYVVRSMWGVNVKQYMTRDEVVRVNTAVSNSNNTSASAPRSIRSSDPNLSRQKTKSSDNIDNFPQNSRSLNNNQQPVSKSEVSQTAMHSSLKIFPMNQIARTESSGIRTKAKSDTMVKNVENYSDIPEKKPCSVAVSPNTSATGANRKMPEVTPSDGINAWKIALKKNRNDENKHEEGSAKVPAMFVQPKSPESRRDEKAVSTSRKRHPATGEMYGLDNASTKVESRKKGLGANKPSVNSSKIDGTTNKKLHTSSTCRSCYVDPSTAGENERSLTGTSISNLGNRKFFDRCSGSVERNDPSHTETPERNKSAGNSGSDLDREKSLKSHHTVEATLHSKDSFERVQTMHPDVTIPPKEILGASEAVRNASRLVQQPLTSLSEKIGLDDTSPSETIIRRQIPVDLERDANTYELKNYSYLRPDEIKEMRLTPVFIQKPNEP